MSALTDPIGAGLDRLVEAQRGMTDWEADWFLRTGQLPDLTKPPVDEPVLITDIPTITESEARAFLAGEQLTAGAGWGAPSEIVFKFDPSQKRDAHGRWTRTGGGDLPNVDSDPVKHQVPSTDAGFEARQAKLKAVLDRARKTLATDITYSKNGVWDPARDRMHRDIAAEMYDKARDVPNEGKAVIAGGLGGAGKSTVLRDHAGVDTADFLTLNPDDIKEEMARRGLVPDVPEAPELSPMERSVLIHEESSRIARLLADMAYRDRKNVIWDVTMSSKSSTMSRVDALNQNGYNEIQGVFVDIPVDVSVERALGRYRRGLKKWADGSGYGGRYVPPEIIRQQRTSSGSTVNRAVFDEIRSSFDGWAIYDNSVTGRAPQLIDQQTSAKKG